MSLTVNRLIPKLFKMLQKPEWRCRRAKIGRAGLLITVAGFLVHGPSLHAQQNRKPVLGRQAAITDSQLTQARNDVIQKIGQTKAGAEKLLALHEAERVRITELYDLRREQYYAGLISRNEVLQVEQALAQAMIRVDEDKRWLAETDMALTEYTMRDELLRMPGTAMGSYSESRTLVRFNGPASWSLIDAGKIESFFSRAFGRALPISAFGQTATHDRLRFDHRNAIDVALHPDSREGRSLLGYLRQTGIPFIAFRSAVPGSATGAHIHIGKPSVRN